MILITDTFQKNLDKIKSISLENIVSEIQKHQKWLQNFIEIWNIWHRKIMKWYLLSKKVRLVVLFQEKNGKYLPFYVVKKETKDGFNISKYSLDDVEKKLDWIFQDLETGNYYILD